MPNFIYSGRCRSLLSAGLSSVFFALCLLSFHSIAAAQEVCPRPASGTVTAAPPELSSVNGTLEVSLNFRSMVDSDGLTRYCYITDAGQESPTLRVHPGDTLTIHFRNQLTSAGTTIMDMSGSSSGAADPCNAPLMTTSSTNMHFHGLNISPTCHQDEVIHTLVQPGDTFDYTIVIPANEPSGLYWYHPHAHGLSDQQVNGGATGAIIVEGLQEAVPALASLTERTFVLRDQPIPASDQNDNDPNEPSWNVSVNFVPILYPAYQPATIETQEGAQELWRVVNSAADTIFNLQLISDGTPQTIQIYAVDGVPVAGGPITTDTLFLPPGDRAEFVVQTPQAGHTAQWVTTRWDAGPEGDSAPPRPLASVTPLASAAAARKYATGEWKALPSANVASRSSMAKGRFSGLASATPAAERTLFFYEEGDESPTATPTFFITVDGQDPEVFSMMQAPSIITHSGAVEDWTIQNRTSEDHIFHIHQIHFQVLEVNGVAVSDPAIRDTMRVDHWSGIGPYPSIKVRMDFRDPTLIGTFVYHCHILDHEDHGMMGEIQLLPPAVGTTLALSALPAEPAANTDVVFTANVNSEGAGGSSATGYVTFTVDGSSVSYPELVSNGVAVFHTTFPSAGNHVVTAAYGGDDAYLASTASPLTVTVPASAFTLGAGSTQLDVSENVASTVISTTAVGGFASPISLACSLPAAMTEATCSLSSDSLNPGAQSTLTIRTTPPHSVVAAVSSPLRRVLYLCGLLPLTALGLFRRRRSLRLLLSCIAVCSLALFGCSGGPLPQVAATDRGTPAGTYTVVVVGTSGQGATALTDSLSIQVSVK